MKKIYFFLVVLVSSLTYSQVINESFDSAKMMEKRGLKIQLPRNYKPDGKEVYPLVVVLDGDYLFEPVSGNVDYQSYWNDMPDCIVVGIQQAETRDLDFYYSEETDFPAHEGALFFEFVGMELIPYLQDKYRASDFRIAVGHDMGANFLNYYLFKDYPVFDAYIMLSPDFAPTIEQKVAQRFSTLESETFYYLATAEDDIARLKANIESADKLFSSVSNQKLHYKFDNFEDSNHYSLVGQGIPKALNSIFFLYKPISAREYKEEILTYSGSPMEYLLKKYEAIKELYGFEKKVIENDLRAVAAAADKNDDIETLKELSKLARKEYPDSMISAYYQGLYFEEEGNMKKALQYYQSGLLLEPSQFINKDILLDKIYDIQGSEGN